MLHIIILGCIVLVLGCLILVQGIQNGDEYFSVFLIVVLGLGFFYYAKTKISIEKSIQAIIEERQERIEEAQENVENGYKMYIDGREVDINTVNLDNYTITIKDDEKIVILDKKR